MFADILLGVIGTVICSLLYKMSRSLGKMEATLKFVGTKIDDHEGRIRELEYPKKIGAQLNEKSRSQQSQ